jgi:hypothetical protein
MRKLFIVIVICMLPSSLWAANNPSIVIQNQQSDQQNCITQQAANCVNYQCLNSEDVNCTQNCNIQGQNQCSSAGSN